MAYGKNSLSTVVITALILLYETSEVRPNMDYSYESSNIPSGVLHPISGAVPVSVRKEPPSGPESRVLRAIRRKIDKNHVSELDYSIQADLFQDVQIPDGCSDTYRIRDGVVKHLLRGSRDIIVAVFRDVKDLMDNNLDGLPLAPNVVNGVSRAITDVMCGAEDIASDVTNSFDTLTDIITGFLLDVLDAKRPGTLLNIPNGLINVSQLVSKLAATLARDIIQTAKKAAIDLGSEIESGVEELVEEIASDVGGIVNRVESDVGGIIGGLQYGVGGVVDRVMKGVRSVAGGVKKGVGSVVNGVEGAVNDILGAL